MSSYIKSGLCFAFTALQVNVSADASLSNAHVKQKHHDVIKVHNQNNPSASASVRSSYDSENDAPAYSRSEVSDHCDSNSCWIIVNNKVYDVTRFLRKHPGGEDIILEHAGRDATSAFIEKGHSRGAHAMLQDYFIGDIAQADWLPEMNCT